MCGSEGSEALDFGLPLRVSLIRRGRPGGQWVTEPQLQGGSATVTVGGRLRNPASTQVLAVTAPSRRTVNNTWHTVNCCLTLRVHVQYETMETIQRDTGRGLTWCPRLCAVHIVQVSVL